MTRIRKNWSSSRGTEDVESPPSNAAVTNDSHMVDSEGKPKSPLMVQLVDEDAMHMLAAVSLESLEQDSGIRNLKRENASAQVMAAMNAKSLERDADADADAQNAKQERASGKIWDQPVLQGNLVGKRSKPDPSWYQKLSALWQSDHRGPASLPKVSTRRETVDEEQSKSSSVADNEMVESELSAKRSLSAAEPIQGLLSGLLQVHCVEREPRSEEASRILEEVFGHAAGRKRRQKPWGSESDLPSTVFHGCSRTDQKMHTSVNSEVNGATVSHRRRLKIVRAAEGDPGICDGDNNIIRAAADPAKVVREHHGIVKKTWSTWFPKPEKLSTADDDDELKRKAEQEEQEMEEGDDAVDDAGDDAVDDAVDDSSPLKAKGVEKGVGNAVDCRKRHREKSQEPGTDVFGDRRRFRAKLHKVESGGAQDGGGTGEDIFPTGWKYKGLAQIAEKDEATNGQVKKLCGRTDGHNWRCPLRVVEGFSLCQHHLNKARAKKMGKTNSQQHQRKELEKKKPDEVSPHTSDSGSFEPSLPCDPHVPTKLRRRHKTAKLSVL